MIVRPHLFFLSVLTTAGLSAAGAEGTAVPSPEKAPSAVTAPADTPPVETAADKGVAPLSAEEQELAEVLSKWQLSLNKWTMEYGKATPERQAQLWAARPDGAKVARDVWRIIRPHLQEAWTSPGIDWFLRNPTELNKFPPPTPMKVSNALLDAIEFYLVGDPRVKDVCPGLVKFNHPRSVSILEKIFRVNKDKITKGHAALALALKLKVGGSDDPASVKIRGGYLVYVLKNVTGDAFGAPFGDMKVMDVVKEELYQINNLSLEQKAPQVKTTTLDGKLFDTGALRGKPVLLVFINPAFNDALPVLENMERIYQNLAPQGLQMVLICPLVENTMKDVVQSKGLTVPVIADNLRAIHTDFRVGDVAQAFLLDGQGTIRFKKTPSGLLEMATQQLISDMKNGTHGKSAAPAR